MKTKRSIQYTLRQIPPSLDEALRRKAEQEGKSLNQSALEAIQNSLVSSGDGPIHRDLDFMAGSWVEDPLFEAALRDQDRIDRKIWK